MKKKVLWGLKVKEKKETKLLWGLYKLKEILFATLELWHEPLLAWQALHKAGISVVTRDITLFPRGGSIQDLQDGEGYFWWDVLSFYQWFHSPEQMGNKQASHQEPAQRSVHYEKLSSLYEVRKIFPRKHCCVDIIEVSCVLSVMEFIFIQTWRLSLLGQPCNSL